MGPWPGPAQRRNGWGNRTGLAQPAFPTGNILGETDETNLRYHTGFCGIFLPLPLAALTSLVRILKLEILSHHWAANGENLLIHRVNFTPDALKPNLRPISVISLRNLKYTMNFWQILAHFIDLLISD